MSYDHGDVQVRVFPDRGRNIGPLLTVLGDELVERYDLIGHFHSKRSVLIDAATGEMWREFLLDNLLGDQHPMMDIIVERFVGDEKLGTESSRATRTFAIGATTAASRKTWLGELESGRCCRRSSTSRLERCSGCALTFLGSCPDFALLGTIIRKSQCPTTARSYTPSNGCCHLLRAELAIGLQQPTCRA